MFNQLPLVADKDIRRREQHALPQEVSSGSKKTKSLDDFP